ncbi:UDP-glucuronosyl/UDP-glucosyltransferase [Macleaya cordata]|uniref:UDP-glucuronosyl/UDP-glucosyltransferase n=1 Tax=Macleaya cordata TaxID=56857 RepID=A0A200QNQ4_MACCD|nr:UDP-glucuronosyl/UDP-glucosyltransferase [Macleaya cordata]
MEELATGLDQSGVRFAWSVREATIGHVSGEYGGGPTMHRAVGSFLTHFGWNSVMESVVAGVPMLAWPMGADQFMNATLLVDQMKVAVRVCEGAETIPNAAELARVLAESVTSASASASAGRVMKRRAMELSKAAMHAIKEGGTSSRTWML